MHKNTGKWLKYIVMAFAGCLLILLCSTIQETALLPKGEYYYSGFLRNNYTVLSASLFFILGIGIGYFFRLNPWLSGLSMVLVFPLVSLYEAAVYRGSHNLIPFELLVFFLFSLPGVAGVYMGKNIAHRRTQSGQSSK
jgi:hypothetical protein